MNLQLPGPFSIPVNFTTLLPEIPSAPVVFPISSTQHSIAIGWSQVDCHGAPCTEFKVRGVCLNTSKAIECISQANHCNVTNLQPDSFVLLNVSASNVLGTNWSTSERFHSESTHATIATEITDLVAKDVRSTSLLWNWNPPLSDGGSQITSYEVVVNYSLNSFKSVCKTWFPLECNASNLNGSSIYCAKVRATNGVGLSAWSNKSCSITTQPTAPGKAFIQRTPIFDNGTVLQVRLGDNYQFHFYEAVIGCAFNGWF